MAMMMSHDHVGMEKQKDSSQIEACAIVYGSTKPEFEQSKKKLNQDDYLKQRIVKAEDQLKKLRKENRQNGMKVLMSNYDSAPTPTPTPSQLQITPPPPPAAATSSNGEMAMMMSHGHVGMTVNNDDIMQTGSFMDLLNGNGDETIPFGQPHDANLQDGFWHNILP
ncbi:agamous-like MADS-box protein AGL80-like [Trifolium medium]|uniref:Agamous-like MADS-box protein AGL80-like n=1 Tax=Trifolium medium TaxID=97028 RepID=A0A392NJZ8_9FABA|nr:agamous-like MADS-box protein AGL80-like [Trifolium medium]